MIKYCSKLIFQLVKILFLCLFKLFLGLFKLIEVVVIYLVIKFKNL